MPGQGSRHDAMQGANSHKIRKCLDCPTMIPAFGNKKRCATCSDMRYDERGKRSRKQRPE